MKISVLGASGGCGRLLVEQAASKGHDVTAVVRSSQYQAPAGVKVVRGALTEEKTLREGLAGCEVVVSALGLRLESIAPWARPEQADFLSKSTPALISAMRATGVNRLLAISAGGVGDSRDKVPAAFRAFVSFSALRHAYKELEVMEQLLLASGLEVCICRPSGLTDGLVTGRVKVVDAIVGRGTISRGDVAAWMLSQLESQHFVSRTPMITVTGAP